MAWTSIHVQYDRYTVTRATRVSKSRKSERSAVRRAEDKQATSVCRTWRTSTGTWTLPVFIVHIDVRFLYEKELNRRSTKERIKTQEAFGECLTKHAGGHFYIVHLLQGDWLFLRRKENGCRASEDKKAKQNKKKKSNKMHYWSNFSTAEEECRLSLRHLTKLRK